MGHLGDHFNQVSPRSDGRPICIKENDSRRRDQLLKSPAPSKPASPLNVIVQAAAAIVRRDNIAEVCITQCSLRVPMVHRVNGFAQLGAARFVDAACVDPYILQAIMASLSACRLDLAEAK